MFATGMLAVGVLVGGATSASAGLIMHLLGAVVSTGVRLGAARPDRPADRQTTRPGIGCASPPVTGPFVGALAWMAIDVVFMPNGVINVGGEISQPHHHITRGQRLFASDAALRTASDIGIPVSTRTGCWPRYDRLPHPDVAAPLEQHVDRLDRRSADVHEQQSRNGVAGFVFRVDDAQQAYVNGLLAMGNIQFVLQSTLTVNNPAA